MPDSVLLGVQYGEGLAEAVREQVFSRRFEDGLNLSDRVWKLSEIVDENLRDMIEQAISEGLPATEFSKAVEEYLKEPGPAWTTNITPSISGRGSVKYNALRLARTETNRAYQEAQKLGHKESEIVKGTKWNLSASHPPPEEWPPSAAFRGYPEICDWRADNDHEGLGKGVYKPGQAPLDHPSGLCYLVSVLYEGDELINILKDKYGTD